MSALLVQLVPVLAPYVMVLLDDLVGWLGAKVPAAAKPAINAVIGAAIGQVAAGNPVTGALVAHIARSGLAHESPATPKV